MAAVGNLEHDHVRQLVAERFGHLKPAGTVLREEPPQVIPKVLIRNKELEQSHVCLGRTATGRTTRTGTPATC